MENIQKLQMQIQGQTHLAAASLETIQAFKSLQTIQVLKSIQTNQVLKYLSKTQVQMSRFALQKPNPIIVSLSIVLISSFLEIDCKIKTSDKKSRRFDLSEVIYT